MSRQITSATTLEYLKKEAKRWLKALHANDAEARARFARMSPTVSSAPVRLRDVQFALAREYGYDGWTALKQALDARITTVPDPALTAAHYERLSHDLVAAFEESDQASLQRLNAHFKSSFTVDDLSAEVWRRVYAFRQRSSRREPRRLLVSEAQTLIAQNVGFSSWSALIDAPTSGASPAPAYAIDMAANRIAPRRHLTEHEWDALLAVMRDRQITELDAIGLMTDAVLARVADLGHVTSLSLEGSRQITDEGLQHLARMPQLERLNLSTGAITDRGLEVLRHLPNLRWFQMTWQRISDAGASVLRFCERLEHVDLMGSTTGDGVVEALQGKRHLRWLNTGRSVTDAGLALLRHIPCLSSWDGAITRDEEGWGDHPGAHLLIDGPFTNQGLASLAGLDGVSQLILFWHAKAITSDGFANLAALRNLTAFGVDGDLADNTAMRHFARMPRLRALRIQDAAATDDGFEALSQSKTIEDIWGRDSKHLGSRGFAALATMPALRNVGVDCRQVEDWAIALLPQFPKLRGLTPIGVTDPGFRHIGRCERLERLTCMYCRETTDAATEHIAALRLKYYYAGLIGITDRSLEILSRMPSLEQVDLYEVNGVTDAGIAFLAALPRLREVHLDGLPGVTWTGTHVLPSRVQVHYTT